MPRILGIDIETYSSAPLPKCGVYRYSDAPDFEILLFSYAYDDEPVLTVDMACGERLPSDVLAALDDPGIHKYAYNAAFERVCLSKYLGHEPIIDRATWECVKALLAQRKAERQDGVHVRERTHFLYGKLFCAECGAPYKRRTMKRGNEVVKAWNCAERQKGKQGNGCKNAILREDNLLKAISEKLGWDWTDSEHFDAARFAAIVRRVAISGESVAVEMIEAA